MNPSGLWWRRVPARAIDAVLLSPPLWWLYWRGTHLPDLGLGGVAVVMVLLGAGFLWIVVGWAIYDLVAVARFGATMGQRVMGIELRTLEGERPRVRDRRAGTVVVRHGTTPETVTAWVSQRSAQDERRARLVRRVVLAVLILPVASAVVVPAASLVRRLTDDPAAASVRLATQLQSRGFAPPGPGERSEHCHRGWPTADCPAAHAGPELRRRGSVEDAIADVLAAARAAGMEASRMTDPSAPDDGTASVVVRDGSTMIVVVVTSARWPQSTLPDGVVAVRWTGP